MAKKLRANLITTETIKDLNEFLPDLGVPYVYVPPVRWWQFWRWARVLCDDYVLSRAAEIILVRLMSDSIREEIEKQVQDGTREKETS